MAVPLKIKGLLVEIQKHGDGVYTLLFTIPKRYTRFKPGQFTHLTLDDFDPTDGFWPESRVFSIASKPKTDKLKIVYSVKGVYTKRMERELKTGEEYWLKFPYGKFTIENRVSAEEEIVLIAGGTGISPFIPYLIDTNKRYPTKQVFLYYGFRNTRHQLFNDEMLTALSIMPNLKITKYSEDAGPSAEIIHGRLDIDTIYNETKDLNSPKFFLSGPPQMISAFKEKLLCCKVPAENIHIDEWE